jgi:hypothetical protein
MLSFPVKKLGLMCRLYFYQSETTGIFNLLETIKLQYPRFQAAITDIFHRSRGKSFDRLRFDMDMDKDNVHVGILQSCFFFKNLI